MKHRVISLLISAALLLGCVAGLTAKVQAAYENTYVNTGNQREDLIGVAMTQVGYTEGKNNDTKYGDWMGMPNQPWCAIFISWCAEQAEIPSSVLKPSAWASPKENRGFNIPCYEGTEYTPQRGDLFFTENNEHVGIVLEVDGENVITLEANTNDDGSDEGYGVLIRSRVIAECSFGVPDYEGGDPDHTYVREYENAHPHKTYYRCTTCGDRYDTGTNTYVVTCTQCKSCSCKEGSAGWYRVHTDGHRVVVYAGHGTGYSRRGFLDNGEAVYVLSAGSTWAHILYANEAGYVDMRSLEPFMPAPGNLRVQKDTYYKADTAEIRWDPVSTATGYTITVLRDGERLVRQDLGNATSFALEDMQPGNYDVHVLSSDAYMVSDAAVLSFGVLDTYRVTYDGCGGTQVPESQIRYPDQPFTLSETIPVRVGYRFLGWRQDPGEDLAHYDPGDVWTGLADTTFYALWQRENAVPVSLQLHSPAGKTVYVTGQSLDTTGLALKLCFDDGTAQLVTDGFETSGFSSETAGTCTVTVTCRGVSTAYTVEILDCVPGDMDDNLTVDKEDVMQLLWHVSFPELYPLGVPTDLNGDGITDKEDVMHLLWHVSFPDLYPLT